MVPASGLRPTGVVGSFLDFFRVRERGDRKNEKILILLSDFVSIGLFILPEGTRFSGLSGVAMRAAGRKLSNCSRAKMFEFFRDNCSVRGGRSTSACVGFSLR